MKKIFLYVVLVLFLFNLPCISEEVRKIEVTSKAANIRSGPSLDSSVIGKGLRGDVFSVLGTEGSWYKIELPPDKEGVKKIGYIYKSIVKIAGDVKTKQVTDQSIKNKEKKEMKEDEKGKKIEKEKLKAEKKAEKERKKAEKKLERKKKKAERAKRRAERKLEREKKKAEKEKVKAQKKKETPKVAKKGKSKSDILFKGFFLKAGNMTEPKVDSLGDKWVLDLGFDSPIGKYATWGLEFQPYFRSNSVNSIDLTSYNLVSNVFLNIKGGINLGKLWDKLKFISVFLGAGPGLSVSYLYVDYQGNTGTDFNLYFSWHIVYGTEISLGKMKIIVEYQNNSIINPGIDPSTQRYKYFLVGLRF